MEQRPLRLGDIVDDYCPRERRITNHVIVAIVGESVRQTRCSTCDAEHVYKEARIPRRRSKDEPGGDAALGVLVSRATEGTSPTPPAPMSRAVRASHRNRWTHQRRATSAPTVGRLTGR